MTIHIAHKMQALIRCGKCVQRQHRHLRAQIRAANTDIHHVGDGFVRTYLFSIGQHGIQRRVHFSHLGCYLFSSCSRTIYGVNGWFPQ